MPLPSHACAPASDSLELRTSAAAWDEQRTPTDWVDNVQIQLRQFVHERNAGFSFALFLRSRTLGNRI